MTIAVNTRSSNQLAENNCDRKWGRSRSVSLALQPRRGMGEACLPRQAVLEQVSLRFYFGQGQRKLSNLGNYVPYVP